MKVSIFNSEVRKNFDLYVRDERLKAFESFLIDDRIERRVKGMPEPQAGSMPGLSWAAIMGLDAIFDRRPKKFPVDDILQFLADDIVPHSDFPRVTKAEVEYALERFSALYPPDVLES